MRRGSSPARHDAAGGGGGGARAVAWACALCAAVGAWAVAQSVLAHPPGPAPTSKPLPLPLCPPPEPCPPCGAGVSTAAARNVTREAECDAAIASARAAKLTHSSSQRALTQCERDSVSVREEGVAAMERAHKAELRAYKAEEAAARAMDRVTALRKRLKERLGVEDEKLGNEPELATAWSAAAAGQPLDGALGVPALNLTQGQLIHLLKTPDETIRSRLRLLGGRNLEGLWRKESGDIVMRVYATDTEPYAPKLELQGRTVGTERLRLTGSLFATADGFTLRWGDGGRRFLNWGVDGVSKMELLADGTLQENGAGRYTRIDADPSKDISAMLRRQRQAAAAA